MDEIGRVVSQTILPDASVVDQIDYDANGNVIRIVPPHEDVELPETKPEHLFNYTVDNLMKGYLPPDVNSGEDNTYYDYNLDRQLTFVDRPDGVDIEFKYDPQNGRLTKVNKKIGEAISPLLDYTYIPATAEHSRGNLESITFGNETVNFSYEGSLLTGQALTGTVSGSVTQTYDNEFMMSSRTVSDGTDSYAVSFTYDNDGLLDLSARWDPNSYNCND